MGLKIGEAIRTYYYYGTSSITDLAYEVFDETGASFASGFMTELGSTTIYYVDWTPDAAGVWLFEVSRGTAKDAFVYHVGMGQEADIELLHDVPTADSAADAHMRDGIGKKNDAAVTTPGTTKSLMGYAKGILTQIADLITRTKGLDDIHDDLVTVLADTNELQGDWVNGGRLDLILDQILADSAELQVDWVNGGRLDLIIDAILADTNELQGDWANDGRLDIILDAVLADTGELQNDWMNGGRLDLILDGAITDIADLITRAKGLDDIHDDLVTVLADTNELQGDWTNGGRLDLIIDLILADTAELQIDWTDGGRLDLLIDSIITYLSHGTYGLAALDTDLGTLLTRLSAARAVYLDELDFDLQAAIAAVQADIVDTKAGKAQTFPTTIDLHQAAGTYDVATGTAQMVTIESIIFTVNDDVSDDGTGITAVTFQTDTTTEQEFINNVEGTIANLTDESQISWEGAVLLRVGDKIQFTIEGGTAAADPTTCSVLIKYRAVVDGGYLV